MALAGNSVLAAAALAAQSHVDVETVHGDCCPLSLYVMTVASSGDRKTACDKIALQPVQDYRKALTKLYRQARAEHERTVEALKIDRQKARESAKSGADFAAKLQELQDAVPPRAPKFLCKEPTAAALMCSLTDGQYGQGVFTDEGGRLLQPGVSGKLLGNDMHRDQGLLVRWLMAAPDSMRCMDRRRPSVLVANNFLSTKDGKLYAVHPLIHEKNQDGQGGASSSL